MRTNGTPLIRSALPTLIGFEEALLSSSLSLLPFLQRQRPLNRTKVNTIWITDTAPYPPRHPRRVPSVQLIYKGLWKPQLPRNSEASSYVRRHSAGQRNVQCGIDGTGTKAEGYSPQTDNYKGIRNRESNESNCRHTHADRCYEARPSFRINRSDMRL